MNWENFNEGVEDFIQKMKDFGKKEKIQEKLDKMSVFEPLAIFGGIAFADKIYGKLKCH